MLKQKYPNSLIKATILRAKEIPLEVLRQPKTTKNEEIIPFAITYYPNNPNAFPIIKQSSDNFQYSKAISNIFQRKKLVKSMSPAHHLERSLCRSKFASKRKNHKVEICGENCLSSPYLLKASLYPCKRVNNFILLQNFFLTMKAVI